MIKSVGIVGSREYPMLERIDKLVSTFPKGTRIISGGARGPDKAAADAASKHGLDFVVFPADWGNEGKAAGFNRNTKIVEASDIIIAFWDLKSSGTKDTINKALKAGKAVTIYPPTIHQLKDT